MLAHCDDVIHRVRRVQTERAMRRYVTGQRRGIVGRHGASDERPRVLPVVADRLRAEHLPGTRPVSRALRTDRNQGRPRLLSAV